jgi:molybdopterin/thiamine biosynthesis adenylyltransferase
VLSDLSILACHTIDEKTGQTTEINPFMSEAGKFDYWTAFSRNLGWVTAEEQKQLRNKHIAIAGLGGVGGFHLLTLARLGIGAFTLAEFDSFELANFNRQIGATMPSIGRPKLDVMIEMATDINPELDIRIFPKGVGPENVSDFLSGVDLYVDGFDFFAFEARERTFAACHAAGVPAITAAPIGMGVALLNFIPGGMSFEEYFRLDGVTESEKSVRLLVGLSPAMLQRGYVADSSYVDFAQARGPSTAMACQLCAGVAATEALKILLKRGKVHAAPVGLQFDAYRNRLKRTWRPWGNRNPLQRITIAIVRRQLATMGRHAMVSASTPR